MAVPGTYQEAPTLEALEAARSERGRAIDGPFRDPLLRRLLLTADLVAVGLALTLLTAVGSESFGSRAWIYACAPLWLLLAKLHRLYDGDRQALRHLTVDELPSLFAWSASGTVAMVALLSIVDGGTGIESAVAVWLVAVTAAFGARSVARGVWRRITVPERVLLLGDGPVGETVARKFMLFPDIHSRLVARRAAWETDPTSYEGELGEIDRIVVASSWIDESLIANLLDVCRRKHIKLTVVPPARGMFGTAVQLGHVADLPVLEFNTGDVSVSTVVLKRCFDVIVSASALVVLAPLFLLIPVAIRLETRGSSIFKQRRAGLGGAAFTMFKFRTMVCDAEDMLADLLSFDHLKEPVFKLSNDPRVTKVGRVLRRTSLDELPQLLNVLRGDMSLVGPRPEQVELVERYSDEQRFRLSVKPGVTGPMQVYGRGFLTLEERLAVEREYIENLSIGRDLRMLALTLGPLFNGRGAF